MTAEGYHRRMPDPAAEFRALYLAHCEACRQAGIPEPTPEEWVQRIDEYVSDPPKPADER